MTQAQWATLSFQHSADLCNLCEAMMTKRNADLYREVRSRSRFFLGLAGPREREASALRILQMLKVRKLAASTIIRVIAMDYRSCLCQSPPQLLPCGCCCWCLQSGHDRRPKDAWTLASSMRTSGLGAGGLGSYFWRRASSM